MKKNMCTNVEFTTQPMFDQESLSAEEEISLSKRIQAGKEAKKALTSSDSLSESRQRELTVAIDDGQQAFEQLVLANLPRARKFAAETFRRNPGGLNTLEDYEQAAREAIIIAAQSFDWQRGCRFGTYAHQCISRKLWRENASFSYTLSVPDEKVPLIGQLKALRNDAFRDEAIASLGITREAAESLLTAAQAWKSLQEPVNVDDADTELGDLLADGTAMTGEEIGAQIDLSAEIAKLRRGMAMLPEDERDLLRGRMGFDGEVKPLRAFVGVYAKTTGGVQKKEIAAKNHLRAIMDSLPLAV